MIFINVQQIHGNEFVAMSFNSLAVILLYSGVTAWLLAMPYMNPANILWICAGPMMCMPFPLSSMYYDYCIIFVFGDGGALAKVNDWQREKLK